MTPSTKYSTGMRKCWVGKIFYVNEITITNYKRDQFSPKNSSYFSKSQEMIKILIFIVIAGIHDEKKGGESASCKGVCSGNDNSMEQDIIQ